MALKVRDRVKETTTTTGTGTITLAGAVTGFRTFSSVLSDNDTTYYAIVGDTQFEVGLGTYSSNTLARTTVLSSSNSNSAVSFSTGTKMYSLLNHQAKQSLGMLQVILQNLQQLIFQRTLIFTIPMKE